jgi:hypothetical protein
MRELTPTLPYGSYSLGEVAPKLNMVWLTCPK